VAEISPSRCAERQSDGLKTWTVLTTILSASGFLLTCLVISAVVLAWGIAAFGLRQRLANPSTCAA